MSYITNFRPEVFLKKVRRTQIIFKGLQRDNHVICRNFFLFFLFLKYCYKKSYFKKMSVFIKPRHSNLFTLLRAPYRYKLGRHQLTTSRYTVLCSFTLSKHIVVNLNKTNQLIVFLKICKNFYPWFESNICYQHIVFIHLVINYKNNFLIKNYKNRI